jgi:RNA polymerase sigma-70 factor (sigma-E family)
MDIVSARAVETVNARAMDTVNARAVGAVGTVNAREVNTDFASFAREQQQRLYRTAYLLCGNPDRAQDLVQSTLVALLKSWSKARDAENLNAYARKVLVRAFLSERRRLRREAEIHTLAFAGDRERSVAGPGAAADLRILILEALRSLPPKPRAMLVLRYWEDLSVEQTAAILGCSEGNVKSQCSRSLDKLRTLLGEPFAELVANS